MDPVWVFPAGSIAFTWNAWLPDPRLLYDLGDEHDVYVVESFAQRNVEFASLEENVNEAVVELVGEDGYVSRLAIGGVVSIVQA